MQRILILDFCFYRQEQRSIKKYTQFWNDIKNQIETINGGKPMKYKKDFTLVKVKSNDDLSLGKISSIPVCMINIASVLQKDNKYNPKVYLHESGFEL